MEGSSEQEALCKQLTLFGANGSRRMDTSRRMCSRSGQHLGQVYPSADGNHIAPALRFTVLSLTELKNKDIILLGNGQCQHS